MNLLLELGSLTLTLILRMGRRPLGLEIRNKKIWKWTRTRTLNLRFPWILKEKYLTFSLRILPPYQMSHLCPWRKCKTRHLFQEVDFGIGTGRNCTCKIPCGRVAHSWADGCRPVSGARNSKIYRGRRVTARTCTGSGTVTEVSEVLPPSTIQNRIGLIHDRPPAF